MSDQVQVDKVDDIRRRAARAENLGGVIPARQYVSDVRCLLEERDILKVQLEMEGEATHANFEMYQRAQDENDRLHADIMLLKRGKS